MRHVCADLIARKAELIVSGVRQTGLDEVDGGAFVSLLLERFAPAEVARTPKRDRGRYPGATHLYKRWRRVGKPAAADAGDIVA